MKTTVFGFLVNNARLHGRFWYLNVRQDVWDQGEMGKVQFDIELVTYSKNVPTTKPVQTWQEMI